MNAGSPYILPLPGAYKLWDAEDSDWIKSEVLYREYKKRDNVAMELLLIGLDGMVKHRWNRIVNARELFVTIDVMPMRQSELKKGGE